MKKILFYGFMTMLIVGLSSCSKNENEKSPIPPEPEPVVPILVSKVTVTTDFPNKLPKEVLAFTYDDNYRVKQATWFNGKILKYTYSKSAVDLSVTNNSAVNYDYHFEIENGLPVHLEVTPGGGGSKLSYQLVYDKDNYLQQTTYISDKQDIIRDMKWEDGNLIAYVSKGREYRVNRPSTYLNKTNVDLSIIISNTGYEDLSYFSLIKLLGKSGKNIMENVSNVSYDYQYKYTSPGTDGYLSEIVKTTTDMKTGTKYTTTYDIEYLNK